MARILTFDELAARVGDDRLLEAVRHLDASEQRPAIDQAYAAAEALAISYLSPRYGDHLPNTPDEAPMVLKDQIAILAYAGLVETHRDGVAEDLQRRARSVIDWLRAVQRGDANLDLAGSPPIDRSRATVRWSKSTTNRRMRPDQLAPWMP